jgi:AraC-like DNA-binding protein
VFWIIAVVMLNVYKKDVYELLRLSSSILLYWIGYLGFYKYNVVEDRIFLRSSIDADKVLISPDKNLNPEKRTDEFFNQKHQSDFNTIHSHLIDEKLYLDPLLSMETVASDLGMSKSYFSKLINSYSTYNFSDFINSLRVEQAKKFLSDDEFSQYTNVAIGLECGFNSKSTFYSAFKKFTSETPTTYRAQF